MSKEQIAELIFNELYVVSCDDCRMNSFDYDDHERESICSQCRKTKWGISKRRAMYLADRIMNDGVTQ